MGRYAAPSPQLGCLFVVSLTVSQRSPAEDQLGLSSHSPHQQPAGLFWLSFLPGLTSLSSQCFLESPPKLTICLVPHLCVCFTGNPKQLTLFCLKIKHKSSVASVASPSGPIVSGSQNFMKVTASLPRAHLWSPYLRSPGLQDDIQAWPLRPSMH